MTVLAPTRPQEEDKPFEAPLPHPLTAVVAVPWFAALVVLMTLARLYLMIQLPLTGDEAYYWQWSRHLAFGYYDHPPVIAWSVALFNAIFGRTLFATRLAGPFFITVATVFLYLTGRDLSGSPRIGAIGASIFLVAPLPAIGGMAVVPDAPMMAFWSITVYFLQRALFHDDRRAWMWGGISMGLALMSKLMAFFLMPSLLLFLVADPEYRVWLRRKEPYLFVLVGLLVASPFLAWNATHHWETFLYQATSRMQLPPSPHYFLDFMAYEAVAFSPPLFLLAVGVLVYSLRTRHNHRLLFLGCFCACILLTFVGLSFRTRAGGHWPFPGYLSLLAAMGLVWQIAEEGEVRWGRFYRGALRASAALAAVVTLAVYLLMINPSVVFDWVAARTVASHGINKGQKVTSKDLAEIYGYEELAARTAEVQAQMAKTRPTFVVTDSYALSSIIAFYSGLDTHVARGSLLGREYRRWDHFDQLLGQDAVYVDLAPLGQRPDIELMLKMAFHRVEADPPLQIFKDGQAVRQFYIIRCYGFHNNDFEPTGGVQ